MHIQIYLALALLKWAVLSVSFLIRGLNCLWISDIRRQLSGTN